ncbi:MAG: hypothetical protein PVI99_09400, partial [Anaerolineales bacterium]
GGVQAIPASKLPESLQELPMLNATRIRRGSDFLPDVDRLIRGIERVREEQVASVAKERTRRKTRTVPEEKASRNLAGRVKSVPVWGWAAATIVIVGVLGVIFGPGIWEQLSTAAANRRGGPAETTTDEPTSTYQPAEPTEIPDGVVEYLEWMNAVADTTPDFIEDFSIPQRYWSEEYVNVWDEREERTDRDVLVGELVTHGALNIIDEPEHNMHYTLQIDKGNYTNFVLQLDFAFKQLSFGSRFAISFREGWNGAFEFIMFPDGEWELWKHSSSEPEELASGQITALVEGLIYEVQLFTWGDMMAVVWHGELLAYFEDVSLLEGGTHVSVSSYKSIDIAIDNIEIWDLSEIPYLGDISDEVDQAQVFYKPIREHLSNTLPDFEEDFETPQPYWDEMVTNDDGILFEEQVNYGKVTLGGQSDQGEIVRYQMDFPGLQGKNVVLQFDFMPRDISFGDDGKIDVHFLNEAVEGIMFLLGFEDQEGESLSWGLFRRQSDDTTIGLQDSWLQRNKRMDQYFTLLIIFYQGNYAAFLDGYLLGYLEGVELPPDQQIRISAQSEDILEVEFDNIKFWNLDEIDINGQGEESGGDTSLYYEQIQNFVQSEISPTFEDDFSAAKPEWGANSEGVDVSSMLQNGDLLISTDEGKELSFPTNGLFNASDFAISFDIYPEENGVGRFGFVFHASKSAGTYYQFGISYTWAAALDGWLYSQSDGSTVRTTKMGTTALNNGYSRVWIIVRGDYFAILINDKLVHEDFGVESWGEENQFLKYSGSSIRLDNVSFWNLDGVEINP